MVVWAAVFALDDVGVCCATSHTVISVETGVPRGSFPRGRCHGGRRPSSDDSFQSNRHSTIGTRQTEYHEALPSSANEEVRCDCTFVDDSNAS